MNEASENLCLIDSGFMKLEEIPLPTDLSNSGKYTRLNSSGTAQISGLMQILPAAITGKALRGAYRVEFPAGVHGELTPHNGGFLTTIRDVTTKRYSGSATMFKLDDIALATNIFSALSVITNQYYIHQINRQLTEIQSKLDHVLEFLYNDKACEIFALVHAAFDIYRNYSSIMGSPEQRVASIQTLQQAKIAAERNIQFYYRDMSHLAKTSGNFGRIRDDLHNYTHAIYLYGVCTVMEIVMSQNFDRSYLTCLEEDLREHTNQHNKNVANLQGIIMAANTKPGPLPLMKSGNDSMKKELLQDIQAILDESSPVKSFEDTIARIRTTYTSRTEYLLMADGTVYQKLPQ